MVTPVAAIVDYTSLQNAVADYLIRDDLTTQIQSFISFAEAEFNRILRNRLMLKRAYIPTVAGQDHYALPADFLETQSMVIEGAPRYSLQFLSVRQMEDQALCVSTQGRPRWYTSEGGPTNGSVRVLAVPDAEYRLGILYYAAIPPLSTNS